MSNQTHKNEIQLLDALIVMAKYKMFIIKLVFSITLIALIISLVWPKTYKSDATILPPAQEQGLSGIAGMIGGMMPLNIGTRPETNPETILAILNSRNLRVEAIETFNLYEVYRSDIIEELLMKLEENITIEDNREGGFGFNPISSVKISVTDREPERAQQMADFFVRRADETINEMNKENAREQFQLIAERYERNLEEMEAAEVALKEFQETYGIIEVEEQAKAIIESLANIKARIVETEVAINVMRHSARDNNPELRTLLRTKAELEKQYDEFVRQSEQQAQNADVMPPLLDMPELALQYYRLYREVTVQNNVYEMLYPQYDMQKVMSEADKRGIQVLDSAHLPTYKDAPKRAFIVLGGMVFSIFLSILIVFYRNTMEKGRQTDSARYRQINQLMENLRFRKKKQ